MYHYHQKRKARIKCDASHSELGAALEQKLSDGTWSPIAFAPCLLIVQEKKYSTNELELLAIIWSCETFRNYLLENKFEALTDRKAIISALNFNRGNKSYQSRLTRWTDRILPFDFEVNHIAGSKLGIVDYLSRNPSSAAPKPSSFDEQFVVKSIQKFFEACDTLENLVKKELSTDQKSDQYLPVSAIFSSYREIQPSTNQIISTNQITIYIMSQFRKRELKLALHILTISLIYFTIL